VRKCAYCGEPELCGVDKDNIPVCEQHFNEYLSSKMATVKKITKREE